MLPIQAEKDKINLPLERHIAYVAGLAAVGWVCGYIGWAIKSSLLPPGAERPSREDWTSTSMGLAGAAGVAWILSELTLY